MIRIGLPAKVPSSRCPNSPDPSSSCDLHVPNANSLTRRCGFPHVELLRLDSVISHLGGGASQLSLNRICSCLLYRIVASILGGISHNTCRDYNGGRTEQSKTRYIRNCLVRQVRPHWTAATRPWLYPTECTLSSRLLDGGNGLVPRPGISFAP